MMRRPLWYAKYLYCVYVDADALSSVVYRALQSPGRDKKRIGYINLVRLRMRDIIPDSGPSSIDPEDEEHDEDEGDQELVKIPLD